MWMNPKMSDCRVHVHTISVTVNELIFKQIYRRYPHCQNNSARHGMLIYENGWSADFKSWVKSTSSNRTDTLKDPVQHFGTSPQWFIWVGMNLTGIFQSEVSQHIHLYFSLSLFLASVYFHLAFHYAIWKSEKVSSTGNLVMYVCMYGLFYFHIAMFQM